MRTALGRRRVPLLALLLTLAFACGIGALLPDDAPGRGGVPLLSQPAGPPAGLSPGIDRLRAALLAQWRRGLAALLGSSPAPGCPEPPARNSGDPAC